MTEGEFTKHGFKWGFVEVVCIASNDGTDKKKKFNILEISHSNGDVMRVTATKEGFEVEEIKK